MPAPTFNPTSTPTSDPTNAPTDLPTNDPASDPTQTPTDDSKIHLTAESTDPPTKAPTIENNENVVFEIEIKATPSTNVNGSTSNTNNEHNIITIYIVVTMTGVFCIVIVITMLCRYKTGIERMKTNEDNESESNAVDKKSKPSTLSLEQVVSNSVVKGGDHKVQFGVAIGCEGVNMSKEDTVTISQSGEVSEQGRNTRGSDGDEYEYTKSEECNQIVAWLADIVRLPQYLDNFVSNGYNGIDIIQEIHCNKDLEEIGIVNMEHQDIMLAQIQLIRYRDTSYHKTETLQTIR